MSNDTPFGQNPNDPNQSSSHETHDAPTQQQHPYGSQPHDEGQRAFGGSNEGHSYPQYGSQPQGGQPSGQTYGGQPQGQYGQNSGSSSLGQSYGGQSYGGQQYGGQQYGSQPQGQYGQTYGSQPQGTSSYTSQPEGQYGQSYGSQPQGQYAQPYGSQPQGDAYAAQQYGQQQYGQPVAYGQQYGGAVSGLPYASWGKRVGASLVDFLLLLPFYALAMVFIPRYTMYQDTGETVQTGGSLPIVLLMSLIMFGISLWNQGYRQGTTGQSIGKKVLGTKLVSERTGEPVGFGSSFVRMLAHVLDAIPCYVGYLWPLWDAKKQTFADKVMSTAVVEEPKH